MRQNKLITFLLIISILGAFSCDHTFTPKPKGYFRIAMPQKSYLYFESEVCSYSFDYPSYSLLLPYKMQHEVPCWYNINFPLQHAQLHLSYLQIDNNLRFLLDESHKMAFKHQVKSNGISDVVIMDPAENKYGLIYHIAGNAASPLQFFVTDSANHFLRGSLYFMHRPNADSIGPVLDFIEEDIEHLIESLSWE